jgi:hypothetical protein
MDHYEKVEGRKKLVNSTKLSSSTISDIDQLCNLIDESTFGLKTFSLSSKFSSIPSYQIKAFRSSRLKRLHSSKSNITENNNNNHPSTFSMRLSISTSLLNKFRSLSTYNLPQTRRYSSPRITLFRTKSILPSINEEDMNSLSTTQSQLSCTIVDTRRANANSCNVEELAAYLDNFLYLPKSLSGAAELMYT